jgi:hypothetical protein
MKTPKLPIVKFKDQKNVNKAPILNTNPKSVSYNPKQLPVLLFKNRRNNGKNVLYANCPEAEALLYLMRPRLFLEPFELCYVAKMGYAWEISGDKREFKEEMSRIEAENNLKT